MDTIVNLSSGSLLEALWTIILNQDKEVQLSLSDRLNHLLKQDDVQGDSDAVFHDEFEVYASVAKALAELKEAKEKGVTLPNAFDLIEELKSDEL